MAEGTMIDYGTGYCRYWRDWPGFDFEEDIIKKALD